jgi:hypothetical protein
LRTIGKAWRCVYVECRPVSLTSLTTELARDAASHCVSP